jgi:hypothetical protein
MNPNVFLPACCSVSSEGFSRDLIKRPWYEASGLTPSTATDQIVPSFISLTDNIKEGKPVDVHAKKAYCWSKGKAPFILNL